MTAGMLAEHQLISVEPDRFGSHDFVGFLVHQHTMLMNAGFVSKGIGPDDRLVRLDDNPRNSREQSTGTVDMFGVDIIHIREDIAACPHCHDDFFKRAVPCSLADPVDRTLNLAGTGLDSGQ